MTASELAGLADAASVDPSTLAKYLAGVRVQPRIRARIEHALRDRVALVAQPIAPSQEATK